MSEKLRRFGALGLDGILSMALPSQTEKDSKENLEVAHEWLNEGKHLVIVTLHHSKRDVIEALKAYRRFLMYSSDRTIMPIAEHQYSKKYKAVISLLGIDMYPMLATNLGETRKLIRSNGGDIEAVRERRDNLKRAYFDDASTALSAINGEGNIVGFAIGATREAELTTPKAWPLAELVKYIESPENILIMLISSGFTKETNYLNESLRGYSLFKHFTIRVGKPFKLEEALEEQSVQNFESLEHLLYEKFRDIAPEGYSIK